MAVKDYGKGEKELEDESVLQGQKKEQKHWKRVEICLCRWRTLGLVNYLQYNKQSSIRG